MRRRGGNLVFISQIPLTETNNLRDNRGPNAVTSAAFYLLQFRKCIFQQ